MFKKRKKSNVHLEHLYQKIRISNDTKWIYLFENHLKQALNLFNIGESNNDPIFFRDCISRANKVFEGVVRLLYDLAKSLDNTISVKREDIFNYIKELLQKGKISKIFGTKLDDYRNIYRNPETHKIFRDFGESDAEKAINEAFVFLNIGLDNYNYIKSNKIPIKDDDYLYLIFNSFIESFAIYSEFFQLYDKRFFGIYTENMEVLLDLIKTYHSNSVFSQEFSLISHPIIERLRPHFKVILKSENLTFTVIKITEMDLMHYSTYHRLKKRILKYIDTFDNLFFLIWSFSKRSRLEDILNLFLDIPHYHLSGLDRGRKITFFL